MTMVEENKKETNFLEDNQNGFSHEEKIEKPRKEDFLPKNKFIKEEIKEGTKEQTIPKKTIVNEQTHHNSKTHMVHKNKQKRLKNNNIWQIVAGVLAALLIIAIYAGDFSSNDNNLSKEVVGEKTLNYINTKLLGGQAEAQLKEISEKDGMYFLKLNVQGQDLDTYVSKTGNLFFPQVLDMTQTLEQSVPSSKQESKQAQEQQSAQNLKKSEVPKVELFVMSYCPYGTQMEKGILPVIKELGDNIDFELKFVNYAMHPTQGEVEEQLTQYCIQKDYKNKYQAYLGKFLESSNSKEALSSVGLKESDISQCVSKTDKEFDVIKNLEDKSSWVNGRFPKFMVFDAENQKYGIKGSPTLVINGQQVQSGRDAQSLLNVICKAFIDKPEGCNVDMTSFGTPSPGFGFGTQGGSATSAGCGA